jgi:hypothetical protein
VLPKEEHRLLKEKQVKLLLGTLQISLQSTVDINLFADFHQISSSMVYALQQMTLL